MGVIMLRAQMESYLLVARGSPALVQGLSTSGEDPDAGPHSRLEAFVPATDAQRPTTADVDLDGGYLYYCDVHRYVLPV